MAHILLVENRMLGWRWCVLIAMAGCSETFPDGCALRCSTTGACPSEYRCLSDGYCHAGEAESLCSDPATGDGSGGGSGGQDGGSDPPSCEASAEACNGIDDNCNDQVDEGCATCEDGIKNGDETDIDCGGSCAPCAQGRVCDRASDCLSGSCPSTDRCDPTVVDFVIPGPATWTVPAQVDRVNVSVIGGGGGGSGYPTCAECLGFSGGGAGGGSGGFASVELLVEPGQEIALGVGRGGAGGTGYSCPTNMLGTAGGDSFFETVTASGGGPASTDGGPLFLPGAGGSPGGVAGSRPAGGDISEGAGRGGNGQTGTQNSCAGGYPHDPGEPGRDGRVRLAY